METANRYPSSKWFYVIGILFVLVGEFLVRNTFLPERAGDLYLGKALVIEWLIFFMLLAFWIPKVERQSLKSIGLEKFRWRHLWMGMLAFVVATVALAFSGFILEAIGLEAIRSLQPALKQYRFTTLLGLFLTGTFLEEIFYRGYLIERLSVLSGRRWVAAIASWAVFTFMHFQFFGLGPTIDVGVLTAVLVLLYIKERNVWPCIVVHGINNVLAYLVFPFLV